MNLRIASSPSAGRLSVSVCIPARNECSTIGPLVEAVASHSSAPEVIVMDHDSQDGTASIAHEAGATVISADDVLPEFGPALGKGDVLWRSVYASHGDVIAWLDADLRSYTDDYLTNLLAPLQANDAVTMVRPDYPRTLHGEPTGGGRITESIAKPVLRKFHPHLSHIKQPLAGEYAIRREVAEALAFEIDYGVEIGLLIDVARAHGADSIAQVVLPARVHRNRPDSDLKEPARQVLRTALSRVGLTMPHSRPPLNEVRTPAIA